CWRQFPASRIQSRLSGCPSHLALRNPCAPGTALRTPSFEMAKAKQHRRDREGDRKRRHEKSREAIPRAGGIEMVQTGIDGQRRNQCAGQRRPRRVAEHPFGDGTDDQWQHDQDRKRFHGGCPGTRRHGTPAAAPVHRPFDRSGRTGVGPVAPRWGVLPAYASSFLSSVILAFRSFDTGQPAFAFSAAVSNACWLAPGMRAVSSRCTAGITNPPPDFSSVTVAFVRMLCATRPASASCADSAIEKQPACAAAINSSGLVPGAFSKRVPNEYWVFDRTPLSVEIVPRPDLRSPFHMADALRFMMLPLD